ncbi:MAG: radical SAM protein [Candidatus Bathyarchaeota archaeon]|nr:radical SAM protein [Candidatus Bathyarchaeota archaeon]
MGMWIFPPENTGFQGEDLVAKSLARYFAVARNIKPAKFKLAQKIPADFTSNDPTETLWVEHEKRTRQFRMFEKQINSLSSCNRLPVQEKSYFDLKIELANRILQNCHFCIRNCQTNRALNQLGYCKCGSKLRLSGVFPHFGEEPELVPSGTLFAMGCTIRCRHCQNWPVSQWADRGEDFTAGALATDIDRLRLEGCRNVNLVGGEPTPWLPQWLQGFKQVKSNVPVVWNSNSYYSPETARLLAGFADVYLLDFKYGPGECAEKISDAPRYWETCTANHLEAKKNGELIVRVLVLPKHLECCTKPILNWIAENLGVETRVNLMFQYQPEWWANEIPELRRRLTPEEMDAAEELAEDAGLKNLFT